MPLAVGTRLGDYEITAAIGAGGMGEVYLAEDRRLGRRVALKILSAAFAADADRLARFDREAKTLASLNHPHIAQLHGIADADGMRALVMEFVDGEDLAARIARGAIPLDEAVPMARQIAEALEAAHDQGVIHRDLKPANVKLRPDGTVKVLDFGLAKLAPGAASASSGSHEPVNSPTITTPAMTQAGLVLGTAAYMSPEQAKGRIVDRRADIWAFGCVLYEMLSGKRAFQGEDISDTMVAIFRDEPDWRALPPTTPPALVSLMRQCLAKDPSKRLPHIGVARLDLSEHETTTSEPMTIRTPAAGRWRERLAWSTAAALAIALIAVWLRQSIPAAMPASSVQFSIAAPPGGGLLGAAGTPRFALSPDGTAIIYQAVDSSRRSFLWLRQLRALAPTPIPATESDITGRHAQQIFWSRDGRFIAFFSDDPAGNKLHKLELATGLKQDLVDVPGTQFGGSWNGDGVIILATLETGGIQRISARGGSLTSVTKLVETETAHLFPDFHSDGRHFVYLAASPGSSALYVGTLDDGQRKRLIDSNDAARFVGPDVLLYVHEDALVAQRFNVATLSLEGDPVLVATPIRRTPLGRVAVSASPNRVLAYATGTTRDDAFATLWVDRHGTEVTPQPPALNAAAGGFRLSRDGRWVTFARSPLANAGRASGNVWFYDRARNIETRLANDADVVTLPILSSDNSQVVVSRRLADGSFTIDLQPMLGTAPSRTLVRVPAGQLAYATDWSADGRYLLFFAESERLLSLDLVTPDAKPVVIAKDVAGRYAAALSPDGKWVAYASNEGGQQIFVQPFPDAGGRRWPVSGVGAAVPRWRRDGRELFFIDSGFRINAVTFAPGSVLGAPTGVFQLPQRNINIGLVFDVMPDGQSFVVMRQRGEALPTELTVTVNWDPGFKRP